MKKDNIGIATMDIPENVETNLKFISKDKIPYGHKISLKKIDKGEYIYRYGQIIGITRCDIDIGKHVHSHNLEFSEFDRKYNNDFFIKKKKIIIKKNSFKDIKELMALQVLEIILAL